MRVHSAPPKRQILRIVLENYKKSAVEHSIEKPILFNFENLSSIVCRSFYHDCTQVHFDRNYWGVFYWQFLITYRKIPVIVLPGYKPPPVISPSNLKQIFHSGYKPPEYKPIYFYYFHFFIIFITRWDFSSSEKNKRKLRRQSCVIYSHFRLHWCFV